MTLEIAGQLVVPRQPALHNIAAEMKSAYEERIAAGYDRDQERSNLRLAFGHAARRAGCNRSESRELWRRWF